MTPELARLKLTAYLHDPPQKALMLERGHERYAQALIAATMGEPTIPMAARHADELASAADRPNFPPDAPAVDFARTPTLTHPLSRVSPLRVEAIRSGVDPAAASSDVLSAVQGIAAACGDDLETRYLALWRWLEDAVRGAEPEERRLGALWSWLPADTRVPDHSIWDHMAIRSAIAGAGAEPSFLLFTFGPVQGFIAQARTTRDLWMGSYLLSWLGWQAMRAVAEELGPDAVLYPSLRGQPLVDAWLQERGVPTPEAAGSTPTRACSVAALPNKFLALVPSADVKRLAGRAEDAVREAWQALGDSVDHWLSGHARDAWRPEQWREQMARHLETAWTALAWPVAGAEDDWLQHVQQLTGSSGLDGFAAALEAYTAHGRFTRNPGSYYGPVHGLLQRASEARKLTRPFTQAAEPGFKCNLCGARAPALAASGSYREQVATWRDLGEVLGRPGLVPPDGAERLCAVCLTKRIAPMTPTIEQVLGGGAPDFPSISSMATLTFRRHLIESLEAGDALKEPIAVFLDALTRWTPHARRLGAAVQVADSVFPSLQARIASVHAERRDLVARLLAFDGEWLLPETYERWRGNLAASKQAGDAMRALGDAENALHGLLRAARAADLPSPGSFYAIVLLDGDRMGRWVSGAQHQVTAGGLLHPDVRAALEGRPDWANLLQTRRLFAPSTHSTLGSILRDFALWVVPQTVEAEHNGRVVYAGGDDVLALLPAGGALNAVETLRRRYRCGFLARSGEQIVEVNGERHEQGAAIFRGMGPDATVSAGVLFAHHLYPLGLALTEARRLEEAAKARGGRDALAIGVVRRSGPAPEMELVSRFERGGRALSELIESARQLITPAAGGDTGSGRLPYRLRELAPAADRLTDAGARRSMVAAIAARALNEAATRERLLSLYDAIAAPQKHEEATASPGPVAELATCLRLARFLGGEA